MLLAEWRKNNGLSLRKAAVALGFTRSYGGALLQIENGEVFPMPKTAIQIGAATNGQVLFQDHLVAWSSAHRVDTNKAREAGRTAAMQSASEKE